MSLIYENEDHAAGPATHAIVIGVGAYAHLPGGTDTLLDDPGGMGQLSSPPVSAHAFANWLQASYNNPDKPLASLELFISDTDDFDFELPNGTTKTIDNALINNVSDAVLEWKRRGDTNKNNHMIFYFCGHGVTSGDGLALLLEDYGSIPESPFKSAINFSDFRLGMNQCKARYQSFFVDACRVASDSLLMTANYKGDPIIPGLGRQPGRTLSIYYSAISGERSYARIGQVSFFTDALIKSMKGQGSCKVNGVWRVDTDRIDLGISSLIKMSLAGTEIGESPTSVYKEGNFPFHYIDGTAMVPVQIGCNPSEANAQADLSYDYDGTTVSRPDRDPTDWIKDIEAEHFCNFSAQFEEGEYQDGEKEEFVMPLFQPIKIEVSR